MFGEYVVGFLLHYDAKQAATNVAWRLKGGVFEHFDAEVRVPVVFGPKSVGFRCIAAAQDWQNQWVRMDFPNWRISLRMCFTRGPLLRGLWRRP